MRYAKLGCTGLDCSLLGFGTWQIGGGRWKGLETEESIAVLRHAAEFGVNIFDAAIVYGQYRGDLNEERSRSLELLGAAFGGSQRQEVIINLKLGQVDEYSHRAIYEPRHMVEELGRALKELKTDYVDICLVHAPTIAQIRDGRALSVVQTIQAMGGARFAGYSIEAEPEHAKLALAQEIDVLMLQYNLLDRECEPIFERAAEQGVGVIVGGPFKRGYLTGEFSQVSDLPLSDNYWSWNLQYARAKVEATLRRAVALREEAGGAVQLRKRALNHVLGKHGVASVVVGHRSRHEVSENAQSIGEVGQDSYA